MIYKLFLYWLEYKKNNFSKAIAISGNRLSFKKSWQENAAYRLGLYITIANLAEKDYTWQGLFARSVSLATCGKHQEATEIAFEMLKWHSKRKDYYKLPVALAPFLPELALKLIEDREVTTSLRAALLQKNGWDRECYYLLSQAFKKGEHRLNPELYLYKNNAEVCDNRTRLEYFNAFLVSRGLSQVSLKNPEVSVSPVNLCSSANLPQISGSSLVTILMTSHQSGRYIGKAIASVLSQTWRNIELILIDDASCDDTLEVIADWCRKDNRVKLISLQRNVGTYAAKNIGLQYATGEFVTCHDSDDWAHPLKIERQVVPLLKNRKLICTTSEWIRMQDDGIFYARAVHPLQRFNPSSPLFRKKEVLEKAGAWDWVRTGADSEFAARLKLVFGRKAVLRIKQPLTIGAHRPGSLMTDPSTGYTCGRVPPDRLEYWESWTYWHIDELRAGRKPRMPDMLSARVFKAPESISVPQGYIVENLNTIQEQGR